MTLHGPPVTPNDLNPPEAPFPDFHNVYIHPDDLDHYYQTGQWADGTVLVKELVSVGSTQAVSGRGYFMGEFTGLEVTIKDAAGGAAKIIRDQLMSIAAHNFQLPVDRLIYEGGDGV